VVFEGQQINQSYIYCDEVPDVIDHTEHEASSRNNANEFSDIHQSLLSLARLNYAAHRSYSLKVVLAGDFRAGH
jgi:hypothetical protein